MALLEHDLGGGGGQRSFTSVNPARTNFTARLMKELTSSNVNIAGFQKKSFDLNKDYLRKAEKYFFKDDRKIREKEKKYYDHVQKDNKRIIKREKDGDKLGRKRHKQITDLLVMAHDTSKSLLKTSKKNLENTETLQRQARLTLAGKITGGALGAASKAIGGILGNRGPLWKETNRSNKLLMSVDRGIGRMIKTLDRNDAARRSAEKRIGRKQSSADAAFFKRQERDLKLAEQQSRKGKMFGLFDDDESKRVRREMKEERQAFRDARKRGLTRRDLIGEKREGGSIRTLAESGRSRRTSLSKGIGRLAGGGLRGLGGLARGAARFAPGIGAVVGGTVALSRAKEGDFFGAASSGLGAAASLMPGLGPIVAILLESVAQMVPKGVKDAFNKFAGRFFGKMFSNMGAEGGGLSSLANIGAEFGKIFRSLGTILKSTLLHPDTIKVFGALFSTIIGVADQIVSGISGVFGFFADIISGDKGLAQSFMDNIGPVLTKAVQKTLPTFVNLFKSLFGLIMSGVKGAVVAVLGKKVSRFLGILPAEQDKLDKQVIDAAANKRLDDKKKFENLISRNEAAIGRGGVIQRSGLDKATVDTLIEAAKSGGDYKGFLASVNKTPRNKRALSTLEKRLDVIAGHSTSLGKVNKSIRAHRILAEADAKRVTSGASPAGSSGASPGLSTGTTPAPKGSPAPNKNISSTTTGSTPGSGSLAADIRDAAAKYGVSADFLTRMAKIESRGDPNAVSPTGCKGIFQFCKATGREYGLISNGVDMRFNQRMNVMAGAKLAVDNKRRLANAGVPTNDGMLYIAHQQGAGGAIALWRSATQGTPIPKDVQKNMGFNNSSGMTAAAFIEKWSKKIGDTSPLPEFKGAVAGGSSGSSGGGFQNFIQNAVGAASGAFAGAQAGLGKLGTALGGPAAGALAQVGNFGSMIASGAAGMLAGGKDIVSSLGIPPDMLGGRAGVILQAAQGAGQAAQAEMARMNQAFSEAVGSDPAMQKIMHNTGAMAGHTQSMANKEDTNKTTISSKSSGLDKVFSNFMPGSGE